ncbi:ceramidase [Aspergillus clavatus NRRL 1]|uniref:Alkaline phytoceramidase, putative n=1 Tax=Aspergillus clavatus (strain ATCC 1007 / CBS 513.65 / DSM 816 / NCTC 3887 / NRRL 1 / QM 1276 / 107) TaxID=344612 RepID=A1CIF5_ASPCL|nr:Alkaline phytoceramidase, putative [Aspergillus clavatus NRRL 1]EAW10660.1 Alkaline phytoceramidase, putative [Aspergillus clavatus NRRL 1]
MPQWSLLPFFAYPPSQAGYWSPVTSTLNWCEEDYYATIYSAEIVNTLTNLLFMWLGIKGIRSCRRNGHDTIFQIAFYGYLLVGTGSFLFHATLKYPMQLVDELSMIYTTCLMCYASFSYSRPVGFRIVLGLALTGLAVFITLYYHYLQDPVFHQNAYALLTTVVVLRSMYTMEVTLRAVRRHSTEEDRLAREKQGLPVPSKEHQQYENVRDLKTLKTMWFMVIYGLTMFLGGFLIWNLDNHFCPTIRKWRRAVGLPWGIFLEGHGWWHVMTGVGAYLYIIWGIWLRHCLNDRQEEYHLWWPHFWNFPEIVRTQKGTGSRLDKKST